jgi:hypothetical protein
MSKQTKNKFIRKEDESNRWESDGAYLALWFRGPLQLLADISGLGLICSQLQLRVI